MNNIPFSQVRANLAQLIQQSKQGQPIFISQRGQTSAVLLSFNDYQKLGNQPQSLMQAWSAWHQQHIQDLQNETDDFQPERSQELGRDFSW